MNKYIILLLLCFIFASENKNTFDWKTNLIPIVGQIKNKKYIKAGVLAVSQFYATDKFLSHNSKNQIAKRNTYAWWILGLYVLSIVDAYVDAHLSTFPVEADSIKKNEKNE